MHLDPPVANLRFSPACLTPDFQCYDDARTCVTSDKVCDGVEDCPDGEDEDVEQCGMSCRNDLRFLE